MNRAKLLAGRSCASSSWRVTSISEGSPQADEAHRLGVARVPPVLEQRELGDPGECSEVVLQAAVDAALVLVDVEGVELVVIRLLQPGLAVAGVEVERAEGQHAVHVEAAAGAQLSGAVDDLRAEQR